MIVPGPNVAAPVDARDRIRALVAAGESLRARPLVEVLEVVAEACRRWGGPGQDRDGGEEALAAHYGVPRGSIGEILDAAFSSWTFDSLHDWIRGELGDAAALDDFVRLGGVHRRAFGPRLAVFLEARGVPTTPVADLVAALCVKSPAWLKPPGGGDDLAARFARTLADMDSAIGAAVVVERWERGSPEGDAVLASTDVLVVTGGIAAHLRAAELAGDEHAVLGPICAAHRVASRVDRDVVVLVEGDGNPRRGCERAIRDVRREERPALQRRLRTRLEGYRLISTPAAGECQRGRNGQEKRMRPSHADYDDAARRLVPQLQSSQPVAWSSR